MRPDKHDACPIHEEAYRICGCPVPTIKARIIICGSRSWQDRDLIADLLADLVMDYGGDNITIIVGYDPVKNKPKGVDRLAYQEAQKHGLKIENYPADAFIEPGRINGKIAPLVRNQHMADQGADLCVAFWDGRSTGTQDMIRKATKAGIPHVIVTKEGVLS